MAARAPEQPRGGRRRLSRSEAGYRPGQLLREFRLSVHEAAWLTRRRELRKREDLLRQARSQIYARLVRRWGHARALADRRFLAVIERVQREEMDPWGFHAK